MRTFRSLVTDFAAVARVVGREFGFEGTGDDRFWGGRIRVFHAACRRGQDTFRQHARTTLSCAGNATPIAYGERVNHRSD
jgi:hypothetical protein